MMKKTIALLLITLALTGCGAGEESNDVNQDRIYTDYELFYNANDDVTHAIARFRFGNAFGTILRLSGSEGASVTFNGDTLTYSSIWGGHHREYAGNTVTGGTFVYTDIDNNVYTNTVPSGDDIEFPSGFDTIDKNNTQILAWVGSALQPADQVGIFIGTSWTWGHDALFYTDVDNAISIDLGITQKQNLVAGPAIAFMDRWNAVDVAEGTSEGGRIRYKYRASNVGVNVID